MLAQFQIRALFFRNPFPGLVTWHSLVCKMDAFMLCCLKTFNVSCFHLMSPEVEPTSTEHLKVRLKFAVVGLRGFSIQCLIQHELQGLLCSLFCCGLITCTVENRGTPEWIRNVSHGHNMSRTPVPQTYGYGKASSLIFVWMLMCSENVHGSFLLLQDSYSLRLFPLQNPYWDELSLLPVQPYLITPLFPVGIRPAFCPGGPLVWWDIPVFLWLSSSSELYLNMASHGVREIFSLNFREWVVIEHNCL